MEIKVFNLIFIFCLLSIISCKPTKQAVKLPTCIESKIETLKNQSLQNPPSQVWQWDANGNTYYYFNAPCCDQFSTLYNERCEIICAPDGGFTGKGNGKCPDFGTDVKRTLIWEDQRK